MSLDPSLRGGGALVDNRNVLTRAERIVKLANAKQFNLEKDIPVGLPKAAGGMRPLPKKAETKQG
jgi:small basic protein (TIGR04137 family)